MNVTVDADVLMSTLPVELCKAQSKRMPLAEKLLRLLKITCRIEKLAGLTQASTVNGNAAISSVLGSETLSSTPSKERALPFLPGIHTGPLVRVPDMPFDMSLRRFGISSARSWNISCGVAQSRPMTTTRGPCCMSILLWIPVAVGGSGARCSAVRSRGPRILSSRSAS